MALLSSKDKSVSLKSEERPTTSLRMDKAEQSMEAVGKRQTEQLQHNFD